MEIEAPSEGPDLSLDKEGYLFKQLASSAKRRLGQSKWTLMFCNLIGSSLHFYKDAEAQEPKSTLELTGARVICEEKIADKDQKDKKSKKLKFSVETAKEVTVFAVEDAAELEDWISSLNAHLSLPPSPPLTKEKKRSRMQKIAFQAKKNVAGKVATSALGKAAFRSKIPEEVSELVAAVKHVVERESNSPKKADEFEESLIKIGVKVFLLLDSGRIQAAKLLVADEPLRAGFELLEKCFNYSRFHKQPDLDHLYIKLQEVQKLLGHATHLSVKVLEPHMKPKSSQLLSDTLGYFANADFLFKVFKDSALEEDLENLITAATFYLQFHFYDEDD
eukprot:TRINITY_DN8773_c0_g1_i1.p1 TRINITY_DN8773_c0_g1~~TRINITY_DN8773_c0_g1_i1.p1  ORF type:complete len:334 (+),score=101.55 TRINITY_DN8773_c0_g1_i1:98-1099(+)